jgi:putative DNA primase/helicase
MTQRTPYGHGWRPPERTWRVQVIDGVIRGYTGDGASLTRAFSLEEDLRALGTKLEQLGSVAAVVIDPISAYLGGTDSHKNSEVRALLAPLGELAARHNVAIIAISHLNKASAAQAMMRVTGSLAFVAAARAAYLVASDPADKERRLFLSIKINLAKEPGGLAFRIEGATVSSPAGQLQTSRVMWESTPVTMTADEAMQADTQTRCTAADEAADWLRETLIDGPVPSSEIFERAEAEGFSKRTLKRAASKLGIKPNKAGMSGGWSWSLPPKSAKKKVWQPSGKLAPFRARRRRKSSYDGG